MPSTGVGKGGVGRVAYWRNWRWGYWLAHRSILLGLYPGYKTFVWFSFMQKTIRQYLCASFFLCHEFSSKRLGTSLSMICLYAENNKTISLCFFPSLSRIPIKAAGSSDVLLLSPSNTLHRKAYLPNNEKFLCHLANTSHSHQQRCAGGQNTFTNAAVSGVSKVVNATTLSGHAVKSTVTWLLLLKECVRNVGKRAPLLHIRKPGVDDLCWCHLGLTIGLNIKNRQRPNTIHSAVLFCQ